jgi:hypothetical protein
VRLNVGNQMRADYYRSGRIRLLSASNLAPNATKAKMRTADQCHFVIGAESSLCLQMCHWMARGSSPIVQVPFMPLSRYHYDDRAPITLLLLMRLSPALASKHQPVPHPSSLQISA